MRERGLLAPAERRNIVLRQDAQRLSALRPTSPVIVAGVTGSVPASAQLMKAVAALPAGALVLPGLDMSMEDNAWEAVREAHPENPQHGLARLLAELGVARDDVEVIGVPARGRSSFISQAMLPAPFTTGWTDYAATTDPGEVERALEGVSLIEADSSDEEAGVIALLLRGVAEEKLTTAALVTPDRLLARRVAIKLETMGIRIDDSAGRPLAKTVPGAFIDLAVNAVAERFSPASVVSLLKHPLCRLGLKARDIRQAAGFWNSPSFDGPISVTAWMRSRCASMLRKLRFARTRMAGIARCTALRRMTGRRSKISLSDLQMHFGRLRIFIVVTRLRRWPVWRALTSMPSRRWHGATMHLPKTRRVPRLSGAVKPAQWQANFWPASWIPAVRQPEILALDYADFYRALVAGIDVRPRTPVHPRLAIWGPYEARLQQPDVVILASLNDGVWPATADPDPWLNRPMRAELGLPAPEQAIGFAAHDFAQLLAAPKVYLTRAKKVDGVPSVPSRWLLRLDALLSGLDLDKHLQNAEARQWLGWTRQLGVPPEFHPLPAPAPCPPLALRPRQLSATDVGTLLANPYGIFAKKILRLQKLDALGLEPDARIRGQVLHAALHRFSEAWPDDLPQDVAEALIAEAKALLEAMATHPRVAAFWAPRIERFAHWFAGTEPERRDGVKDIVTERAGQILLPGENGSFRLTARADRIDVLDDGRVRITDYKTGTPPTASQVSTLRNPQLALEALIAHRGGFEGIGEVTVAELVNIGAGGGTPPGQEVKVDKVEPDQLAADAAKLLGELIAYYDTPDAAYPAQRLAQFASTYRYDDYAHLARVKEWSLLSEGGADD